MRNPPTICDDEYKLDRSSRCDALITPASRKYWFSNGTTRDTDNISSMLRIRSDVVGWSIKLSV